MKKIIYYLICTWAALTLSACEDFLTQVSENNTSVANHFETELDVESAVNGMQQQFRSVMGDWIQVCRDRGMILDNYGIAAWKRFSELNMTDYPSTSLEFSWLFEYKVISCANLVLNHARRAKLEDDRYRFYMGQALCVRAYTYFRIIQLWGDAPLIVDYEKITEEGRTPWREIADQIISDLKLATEYLPTEDMLRDSKGAAIRDKQIPSRGTAYAILAHVYAWVAGYGQEPELYTEGIKAADEVVKDPNYSLLANPEEVCVVGMKGNSTEGIYELNYDAGRGEMKDIGAYVAGMVQRWPIEEGCTPATRRKYNIQNKTVEAMYNREDLRLYSYFKDFYEMKERPTTTTQGAAYVQMWREIRYFDSGVFEGEPQTYLANEILIRLADIILLRAEMEAASGDFPAAEADLNRIRERAGANKYTTAEGDLKQAIQRERDKELLLQTLVRYFDRVRNHTYTDLKGGFKTLSEQDVKNGALFFPVSTSAFRDNPAMRQTTYWIGIVK